MADFNNRNSHVVEIKKLVPDLLHDRERKHCRTGAEVINGIVHREDLGKSTGNGMELKSASTERSPVQITHALIT